jgi:hypothetical protein
MIENQRQLTVHAIVLEIWNVVAGRYEALSNMGWLTIRLLQILIPASPRLQRLTFKPHVFTRP